MALTLKFIIPFTMIPATITIIVLTTTSTVRVTMTFALTSIHRRIYLRSQHYLQHHLCHKLDLQHDPHQALDLNARLPTIYPQLTRPPPSLMASSTLQRSGIGFF